jgi:hypothetical protein
MIVIELEAEMALSQPGRGSHRNRERTGCDARLFLHGELEQLRELAGAMPRHDDVFLATEEQGQEG